MGKAPCLHLYVMDWCRDLEEHPLEIEGAWIRICCKLHWTHGELTKTREQWARILRSDMDKTNQILSYLKDESICDISVTGNGKVTIKSRRMVRDNKLKKNAALRQAKYRASQKSNKKVTPVSSISSSFSSSSTTNKSAKKATQWPKNFALTNSMKQYGIDNGIDPEKIQDFFDEFEDWAKSKGATYKDWKAAYRNRVRRAPEFSKRFMVEQDPEYMKGDLI